MAALLALHLTNRLMITAHIWNIHIPLKGEKSDRNVIFRKYLIFIARLTQRAHERNSVA